MSRFAVMIIVYIFEMLTSYCFFLSVFDKKIKSNYLIMGIGLLLFLPSAVVFSLFENEFINLSVFFIINLSFALICFKCSLKLSVIYSILLDATMCLTEFITIYCLSYFLKIPMNLYKSDTHMLIIVVLICKSLYFICSQLFCIIIKKTNNKSTDSKHYLPLFIFPIITIVTSVVFLLISLETEIRSIFKITIAVICNVYFLACVFIFIYYQKLLENEAKVNELVSERRYFELNNTYMDLLQNQNDELQILFHDTKHHYMALNGMDNIEDVKAYIAKIYPELENKNNIAVSKNKMLDLILNKYIVICEKNNIKFNYEVKTSSLDYIDDTELSVIINNILDNAVESAMKSKEKQIDFSLRNINNMDLLSVINSCDTPPDHDDDKLITTKFDPNNHGFGTRIIKRHVQKNNGKYEWSYDENEHKFHSTILFQKTRKSDVFN